MHYTKAAEVSVLGAEWPVDNGDFLNELRTDRLEQSEIALSMPLRGLVLSDAIDQHFKSAVHSTVVEIEPEAADFEGLSASLVLAGVNTRSKHLQQLVISCEQCPIEDLGITTVHVGLNYGGTDYYALMNNGKRRGCIRRIFRLGVNRTRAYE